MPNNSQGPNPGWGVYYSPTANGATFSGGNQALVATALSAGLSATYTGGLVLANPITNVGVNLILQRVTVAFPVAQTNASVIGLGVGQSGTALAGTLTAVASQNQFAGSSTTATGLLYSSASITLPTAPYLSRIIGTVDTGATTTAPDSASLSIDINGGLILPPGGFACIVSSAAGTAASMLASFLWVET